MVKEVVKLSVIIEAIGLPSMCDLNGCFVKSRLPEKKPTIALVIGTAYRPILTSETGPRLREPAKQMEEIIGL